MRKYIPLKIQEVNQSNLMFLFEGNDIGKLEWNDGILKFTGDAEESAKIFFDWLATYFLLYKGLNK